MSPKDKAKIDYSFMSFKGLNEKKAFRRFANLNTADNKNNNKNVAFKGAGSAVTEGIAKGVGKIADTKGFRKFIEWFKEKNQWFPHLIAAESLWLSGFYMQQTAKSKTIEKDQKLPLIINQGVVCGISTVGAYTLNNYLNKKLNNAAELFHISKIEDKNMQEEFLKCKADYSYIEKLQQRAKTEEKLKPVFSDLEKKFEFTNDVKVFVKDEMKKNKNDLAAKEFLKELKSIKKTADKEKADVVKELFFK